MRETFPPPVRIFSVGGVRWIIGDPSAAKDQLQRHGDGGCFCFECLSARAVLAGKVSTNPGTGDEDTSA